MRATLIDLFCGAGGAAVGYARAGFRVIGVDIVEQPHYPFDFIKADALAFMDAGLPAEVVAIHASPPCQAYTVAQSWQRAMHGKTVNDYPRLIEPTRERLLASGRPYIIENVVGAPVRPDFTLCGTMFGLRVLRHRLFEASWHSPALLPPCVHPANMIRAGYFTVTGNGGRHRRGKWAHGTKEQAAMAMGIDWMTRKELSESIPPAYTEWLGRRLQEWRLFN